MGHQLMEDDELHHHLLAEDEEEEMPLTEEMVLEHQAHYGTLWKEHINNGDKHHCGDSYTNDAVLEITALPSLVLSKALKKMLGHHGKLVLRGKKHITKFWKTAMFLGMSGWVDVADEINSTNLVLSDDEVLRSGLFETSMFKGQVVAEYWFRYHKEWRIRSQIIEILESKGQSTDTHDGADDNDESEPQGMSKSVLFMIALLCCAILAFVVRHSKRRSASTIGGFESMLG